MIELLFAAFLVGPGWFLLTRNHSIHFLRTTFWQFQVPVLAMPWVLLLARITGIPFLLLLSAGIVVLTMWRKLGSYSVIFFFTIGTWLAILDERFTLETEAIFFWTLIQMLIGGGTMVLLTSFEERYRYQVVPRSILGIPFRFVMLGGVWMLVVYIIGGIRG